MWPPCMRAQMIRITKITDMANMAIPPIKDRRSREFLYALSHKIKIKMMTKVKRPNMKGDMCLPKVLLPRIIQEMETMMELDTSTR